MNILEAINAEISKLQSVRAILTNERVDNIGEHPAIKRRGRPAGSRNVTASVPSSVPSSTSNLNNLNSLNSFVSPLPSSAPSSTLSSTKIKLTAKKDKSAKVEPHASRGGMSAEGRAAIAVAMRKRWAANKNSEASTDENTNPVIKKTSTKSAAKKSAKKSVKSVKSDNEGVE